MIELFLPDIYRRMRYLLDKHQDQFTITSLYEEKLIINARINAMFDILGQQEDIEPYTMSLVPDMESEFEKGEAYILFDIPIISLIDSISAFLIHILPISTYLNRELIIHNFDNCVSTYSITQDITSCKDNGFYSWPPTYFLHFSVDYGKLVEFFDILSNYYKYIGENKEKIIVDLDKFIKERKKFNPD